MNIIQHIADQLERTFQGDPWHGNSLQKILQGIDAQQAARKPSSNTHSIWELVLHIHAWEQAAINGLQGNYKKLDPQEDWPVITETSEAAWQAALEGLVETTARLKADILAFSPEIRLHEQVPGQNFTFYVLLHGAIQHNLYHAGQIALIKKLSAVKMTN